MKCVTDGAERERRRKKPKTRSLSWGDLASHPAAITAPHVRHCEEREEKKNTTELTEMERKRGTKWKNKMSNLCLKKIGVLKAQCVTFYRDPVKRNEGKNTCLELYKVIKNTLIVFLFADNKHLYLQKAQVYL